MNLSKIRSMGMETAGGLLLLAAALLALILNNSPLDWVYDLILHTHLTILVGEYGLDKSLLHWINDGLMVVFFFQVGLEVKHEILRGDLSSVRKASLPVIAALGGVILPAVIYLGINWGDTKTMHGWAIPMATDIAFAVGILALLGKRVPRQLKILLLSLAIIDDLVAIIVIALFYTAQVSVLALALSTIAFLVAVTMNRLGVKSIAPYILVGAVMWACVLQSGVHATLAGVFLALCIPLEGRKDGTGRRSYDNVSPLVNLEHMLKPWVAYMIMPIFAFANAGVSLSGVSLSVISDPVPLGIIAGLFLGKQLGVFSFVWAAVKMGICHKPEGVTWAHLYGLSILTGIGFTMSLFIGTLAFNDPLLTMEVRIGVLVGSTLSAIVGYTVLKLVCREK